MTTTEPSLRIISRLVDGTQLSGGDNGTTESIGVWLSQQTRPNIVVSADGRWVAFTSAANNLPGDADSGGVDVYLKDTVDGSLRIVSVSATGKNSGSNAAPLAISDDGRWVLFASGANDLGDFGPSPVVNASVYLKDMQTGQVLDMVPEFKPAVANSLAKDGDMSRDARFVVYVSGDSNITGITVSGSQVFLFDRIGGQTSIVSRHNDGRMLDSASDPHVSDDGQWVIFQTPTAASPQDTNTANDVYAWHVPTAQIRLLSVGFDGKAAGGENAQLSSGTGATPRS